MPISLQRSGIIFAISAPSGTGKTTICRAIACADPRMAISISTTTRPRRPKEEPGKAYDFVSKEEFQRLIEKDCFYEYAVVYDHWYGTRRDYLERLLSENRDVLLDIDIQGSLNIKKARPDAVLIYVLPPSRQALKERLFGRRQDSEAVIARRLSQAAEEIAKAPLYDYILINDRFDDTVEIIRRIIAAERCRSTRLTIQTEWEETD